MKPITYRLILEPESSILTPFHSDTLFGHLCWMAANEGEKEINNFLDSFKASPPFILSSGFAGGMLPIPCIGPLQQREKESLSRERCLSSGKNNEEDNEEEVKALNRLGEELKGIKEVSWIPIQELKKMVTGFSKRDLYLYLLAAALENSNDNDETIDYKKESVVMRTAVNRISGSALENKLFDHSETFYGPGAEIDVWFRFFDPAFVEPVKKWLNALKEFGFGANASTGSGRFKIRSFTKADGVLPESSSPNAFISLSHFTPEAGDPVRGHYHHIVKRGKLGGAWSSASPEPVNGSLKANVWKKPLIMFEPGSLFYLDEKPLKMFYGRMVRDIHPIFNETRNYKITQYAFAFPLGARIVKRCEKFEEIANKSNKENQPCSTN